MQPVVVTDFRVRPLDDDGWVRVAAAVDGEPLWFDFDNALPVASAEGFATAVAGAALAQQRPVRIEAPLSASWSGRQALDVYSRWWGYPPIDIHAEQPDRVSASAPRSPGTGLCFSGGADSFHSLLCGSLRPDVLVLFWGADVPLEETGKLFEMRRRFRLVAEATGTRLVCVRTNFRVHGFTSAASYPLITHGGMLAAAGHFLRREVGRLLISASYPKVYPMPWGSRWDVDPFWSDDTLQVVHVGADKWKADKLREIADNPLVRSHLRVCWTLTSSWNCGACEKCMRTMIVMRKLGVLDRMESFPDTGNLPALIDACPLVEDHLIPIYLRLARGADPELAGCLRRLIHRTSHRVRRRRTRRLRRAVAQLLPARLKQFLKQRLLARVNSK